ncbi:MAG: hypothetical protein Q9166_000306 [cf. Caloplaca sp. 2 TL-2023]
MTLDDFEKSLAEEKRAKEAQEACEALFESRKRRKHSHHQHHHRHRHDRDRHEERLKRLKQSKPPAEDAPGLGHKQSAKHAHSAEEEDEWVEKDAQAPNHETAENIQGGQFGREGLKRDTWMEEPSALDIDFTQKGIQKPPDVVNNKSSNADFQLKIHDNELNKHHLQDLADGKEIPEDAVYQSAQHTVDYTFGDSGAEWRMTKLKAVYRRTQESGADVDEVATQQYGDLRVFDDAREEETELERRKTYGEGYVGKEKPSGKLFQERKLEMGVRNTRENSNRTKGEDQIQSHHFDTVPSPSTAKDIDQTTLNRLKAQMMRAKLRGSAEASKLEAQYNEALSSSVNPTESSTIILGAMNNRMLAGGRNGEVKAVETKRGHERGLVEENEDMSIEDMVKQERRTRNQLGGDGQRFAERIVNDAKFDVGLATQTFRAHTLIQTQNDLEYMDENAAKLAKRVQKSEINLKNTAISEFQKTNRILDNCPLCHHEDSNNPPAAPVVSLATRVYLTLPTEPEISDGGACIIPVQHRGNLLECDDDEWEEIRNFMKSLTRMYHDQGRDVIFYENAAAPQRKKHAGMEVVPLPYSLGETAPAFFKEAILTSDEEWTQHKKLLDTLAKAKQGLGKLAFRRTLAKEMPYFHVWFKIDGGLGHIVEDANRWPKGDLFAREIIGGMLDKGPDTIKRQGKWHRGGDHRLEGFRKRWRKFDWTRVLTES